MNEALEEAIGAIQRVIVETLHLDVEPVNLDPDLAFPDLEIRRYLKVGLDSVDLVEVIVELEDRLRIDLLEDEEFRNAATTIRKIAAFLCSRHGPETASELAS